MTAVALSLMLLWRDSARQFALLMALFGVLGIVAVPHSQSALWIVALTAPTFLIGLTLTVPTFSAFELAMPITRANLLWSHNLASLTAVWLPVLIGLPAMLAMGRPLANARPPVVFAVFFTAGVCLATSARVSPRPAVGRTLWVLALLCGLLALRSLPWPAALGITVVAALPLLGKLSWTYAPERKVRRSASVRPAVGRPIWPLLGMLCSLQALVLAPLAFLVGRNLSWTGLPFAGMFLMTLSGGQRYLITLPLSRRCLLLGKLLPVLTLLLAGIAYGYRAGHLNWTPATPLSRDSDWRSHVGNPPGIDVPWDYYRHSQSPPPETVAPWGETSQPHGQLTGFFSLQFVYNPYVVSPENSDRFFEWQFGRATRAIYGQPLHPEELNAAIRAGLKPVTEQPRMEILNMAFAAASLLVIGLLAAVGQWNYSRRLPKFIRPLMKPLGLPFIGALAIQFFIPSFSSNFDPVAARVQPLLFRLSALLPANLLWMTLALLAALATLYWALETVFNQVEFPDKPKENL